MKKVQKNAGKLVEAWKLGDGSAIEERLISEGKIAVTATGYELFSQEAKSESGEKAVSGDYFKIDGAGYPYPNKKEWFLDNHQHIEGDTWEQIPAQLDAWEAEETIPEEVQFLLDHKGLKLNPANPSEYFGATLWGAWLTAAKDAVLVFYSITRENGVIIDADFNFVARSEFEKTYHYCN